MKDLSTIEAEIRDLKIELTNSDYKIIKCMESQLLNEEMPYDYVALIASRKQLRLDIEDLANRKLILEQAGLEVEP